MAPQVRTHLGTRPTDLKEDCGHQYCTGFCPEVTETHDQDRPCACYSGWVFVGYIDEHGEEREASYPCRCCSEAAGEIS
jgi:hypothetical protein